MAKNDKKSLFWPIFLRFLGQTLDLHEYLDLSRFLRFTHQNLRQTKGLIKLQNSVKFAVFVVFISETMKSYLGGESYFG